MIGEKRTQRQGEQGPHGLQQEYADSALSSTQKNGGAPHGSASEFFIRRIKSGRQKSVVLGLACEEYFRRIESGEPVDRAEFFREFPDYQQSVARLLAVHDYLNQHGLLPDRAAEIECWPEPGETVAGYQLLEGLGLGAFSRVFLASEPAAADRRIAVKVSKEGAAEAKILGKLSHPNIVPVYTVRQDEQRGWTLICMPYKGQAALDDVIGQLFCSDQQLPRSSKELLDAIETVNRFGEPVESMPPDPLLQKFSYVEASVHLVAQLADALAYTHAKGICHRDLKPSNVLMAPDGRPMLLDFNLSQDRSAVERRLGGTLPYMAPEQLEATVLEPSPGPAVIDPRSDLFSLGVIAYELLCGEWPYGPILSELAPDEFATELQERQRRGPQPLCERNPDVDPQLSDLIQRCLAFDEDARPQTAQALATELRRCLSLRRRLVRRARARPMLVGFAAGMVLTIGAGLSYHAATREPYGVRELRAARSDLAQSDMTAARRRLDNAGRFGVPADARGALADAYYRTGKLAYEQRDMEAAYSHLTHAIDLGLTAWEVWFYRGATLYRMNRLSAAASDFSKASSAGAGPEADACLGDCIKRLGDRGFREAKQCYLRAVDGGLQHAELLNNLGMVACFSPQPAGRHFDEAEEYFEAAIRLDPDLIAAYFNRVDVRSQREVHNSKPRSDEDTLAAARELMKRAPKNPRAMMCGAFVFARGVSPGDPCWEVAATALWRAFEVGLALPEVEHFPELKALAKTLNTRPGFEDLLRNQPKTPEKLVRQFVMLDELGY